MSAQPRQPAQTRRRLLQYIGRVGGAAALYNAMTALGFAAESPYRAPLKLQAAPKGSSVLILGAGMAGLVAAYELRQAGYAVQVLEFNQRAGGRAWTLRGGDTYTELGGATQRIGFAPGNYFNPGPWRIPYHHHGVLDYAHRLKVPLEPFVQVNHNAYLHSQRAFGGVPQRFRQVQADFDGGVAELMSKALRKDALDDSVTREDRERLLRALQQWGALDRSGRYQMNDFTASRRGWDIDPGGGLMPDPQPSQPQAFNALINSGLWRHLATGHEHDYQTTLFQPVGGMDRIAMALYEQVKDLVQFGAKVTAIAQDAQGVTVSYSDSANPKAAPRVAKAGWCLCTIPLSVLSQIDIQVSAPMQAAINAVPYESSVKVGLEFKRRFWEQDEAIYGGITHTDLPIATIGYPATGYGQAGKAVLLGAYIWGPNAFEFTSQPPAVRVQLALQYGALIHKQMPAEFDNGVAVAWHRVPSALGCFGDWSDAARDQHYKNLCQIDGRIALAGEHASQIPAWQEGAVLSALDAITRLHARILAKA
jgi:monoamine oxidase